MIIKKEHQMRVLSWPGGVGFEPTTTSLGGLRPFRARLPAQNAIWIMTLQDTNFSLTTHIEKL